MILTLIIIVFYLRKRKDNLELRNKNLELTTRDIELIKLNNTKDKLFSIISHDLKNPISSFNTLAEMFFDNYHQLNEDERINFAYEIKNSSSNTLSLLEELLAWSLFQTKGVEFFPENVNITEIILREIHLQKDNAIKKQIDIVFKSDIKIFAFCDKEMFSIIIRNLINNAIKFSHIQSKIHIDIVEKIENIVVSVEDIGAGIAQERKDKIFSKSLQSSLGTNKEQGHGIGLLLCKEFIEMNNGEITFESNIGKGSKFYFTLPKIDI